MNGPAIELMTGLFAIIMPGQINFPKNFLWGAATSAYQVEGNNSNCDWWAWEKASGKEISGPACRHYELYKEDFDLAKSLSHNSHRLSIEWSRIEPEEGKFSETELKHYIDVVSSLKARGIEPIVTLHHFTNPLWFAGRGGWLAAGSREYFLRYADYVVKALSGMVNYWVTINEPLVYAYHAYYLGAWPPQERSFFKMRKVSGNFASAHIGAYRRIHEIYKRQNLPRPFVSIAHNLQAFEPCGYSLKNRLAAFMRDRMYNFNLIERLSRLKTLDYIGVNYYTRSLVDLNGWSPSNFVMDTCSKGHSKLKKTSMGWDIYPQGLYNLLLRLRRFKLPVLILENGIATLNDEERWDFIREHLKKVHSAISSGANVIGYIYWSLMDNFEWDKGFSPRFGLLEMDYNTSRRVIRDSARLFAQVCKTGAIE